MVICTGLLKLNYNPMKQISFFVAALLCLAIYSCSDDGELVEEPTYSKENTTISLEGVFAPSLSVIRDQDTVLQVVTGDEAKTWEARVEGYYDITTPIEVNYQLVNTETDEVYLDTTTTISHSTELELRFFSLGGGIAPLLAGDDESIDPAPDGYVNIRFLNLATGPLENKTINLVYYPYHEDPDTYSFVMDTACAKAENIDYGDMNAIRQVPLLEDMVEFSSLGFIGVKAYDSTTGELLTISGVSDDGFFDEIGALGSMIGISLYVDSYWGYVDGVFSRISNRLVTILITDNKEATEKYGVPMYNFDVVEALSYKE